MRNAIFLTFDDNYFSYAKVCLMSLEKNYPDHPEVLIYYDGNKNSTINFLQGITRSSLHYPEFDFMDLKGLDLGPIGSSKVYFRFILWTEKFKKYDSILHLDVDTIILKPFPELFDKVDFFCILDYTPFNRNIFKSKYYNSWLLKRMLRKDGIREKIQNIEMLNAGVFLIPKKYRTKEQFNKLIKISKKYNQFIQYADQSVITIWCKKNNISICDEVIYNFQLPFMISESVNSLMLMKSISADQIKILHHTWWKEKSIIKTYVDFAELLKIPLEKIF